MKRLLANWFILLLSGQAKLSMPYYNSIIKARFVRVRAARGWGLAYQASSIDLPHQSHPLDPALKASRARRAAAIQLLIKDDSL